MKFAIKEFIVSVSLVVALVLVLLLSFLIALDAKAHPPLSEEPMISGGYHEGPDGKKHKHHLVILCSTDPDFVNVVNSSRGDSMVFCVAKSDNVGFSVQEIPKGSEEKLSSESHEFNELIKNLVKQMEDAGG